MLINIAELNDPVLRQPSEKYITITIQMKKALRETQTLRAAVVRRSQKFSPRRRPPFRGRRTAKI